MENVIEKLRRIYLISGNGSAQSNIEQIEKACKGGVKLVQLRLKNKDEDENYDIAISVKKITDKYDTTLIINDYPKIAYKIGADGVHLGKNDMKPAEAREILGDEFIIGGTADSYEKILEIKDHVDYIGLGPYRFTKTKENLSPVLGLEGYKKILLTLSKAMISKPIYAIGGIGITDVKALLDLGLYGVAVSGAILNKKNIEEVAKNFVDIV